MTQLAAKLKSDVIHHNNFIGGRYSVLSEVGMLPAELVGLRSENFKQFNNLIIVNTDSNLPELKDKLNKIFLNIDTFNKETFIKNYSAGAITSNLDIL